MTDWMGFRLALSAVLAVLLFLLVRAVVMDLLASGQRKRQICTAILDVLYEGYKHDRLTENDLWQYLTDGGMNLSWEWTYRRQLGRLVWQGKVERDGDVLSLNKREFRRQAYRRGDDPGMALAVRITQQYWKEQAT